MSELLAQLERTVDAVAAVHASPDELASQVSGEIKAERESLRDSLLEGDPPPLTGESAA